MRQRCMQPKTHSPMLDAAASVCHAYLRSFTRHEKPGLRCFSPKNVADSLQERHKPWSGGLFPNLKSSITAVINAQ